MSIFVSVGKLIKNGVVDGYSITFFTELDFQGTCPLNAHVECRASLALISYIGEVVCLRNGSRADLGHPIWATRSGRAVLADPIWATHYGRPVLADPIWATRSGRSDLGEPFWPIRSGRPVLADPFWASHSGRPDPDLVMALALVDPIWLSRLGRPQYVDRFMPLAYEITSSNP
jgi:hypothetical protein